MTTVHSLPLSPAGRRAARFVLIGAALLGTAIGLGALRLHLVEDPLADVHAYYDAATRLNAGLPLYEPGADSSVGLYLYPPLLAVLFRPLALLPFEVAAMLWEAVVVLAFGLTVARIGIREPVVLALGFLAMPILWLLAIGQAEALVMLLLAWGSPLAVALAGHLKILPWLVAVHWIGRRDAGAIVRLAGGIVAVGLVQLALEPAGTLAYLELAWLRPAFEVRSISPYAVHPLLWVGLIAGLVVLALRFARTRWGWPLAVALAVFAYPRLLAYQLATLLAGFGGPRWRERTVPEPGPAPVSPARPAVVAD